ncbi:uncharacterized protein LOC127788183 [Diospyros lotus]|uniref:uncharacterized protein LOC127788183 n=1 Tax=Diospyros lotus TaxID=55363 RepID=UPI00225B7158|nr:uncharacterized protein LOC127788183 [Diospyros lotus]
MGILQRYLLMLPVFIWMFWLPKLRAVELPGTSIRTARALDALLQDYAYRAFSNPRTGIPYDGVAPTNLTGIKISAIRLVHHSLRTRGVVPAYKEFEIPVGVVERRPYVKRLVLVYQNLGNWSTVYYHLPNYTYLAPVLGLLAYDASNLSAKHLPELDIRASGKPISIIFSDVKSVPNGSVPKCVWFDLHGLVNFSDVVSGNGCSTFQQGHFSIVVESTAPSPAPPPNEGPPMPTGGGSKGRSKSTTVGIILGSVLGGLALLVLLVFVALWVQRCTHRRKMQQMEKAAEAGETLYMTSVGNIKAPAATVTRTQPKIEISWQLIFVPECKLLRLSDIPQMGSIGWGEFNDRWLGHFLGYFAGYSSSNMFVHTTEHQLLSSTADCGASE